MNTTHCIIVFVAVDEKGKPVEVERWRPASEQDVALERYAEKISGLRKALEEETNLRESVLG